MAGSTCCDEDDDWWPVTLGADMVYWGADRQANGADEGRCCTGVQKERGYVGMAEDIQGSTFEERGKMAPN